MIISETLPGLFNVSTALWNSFVLILNGFVNKEVFCFGFIFRKFPQFQQFHRILVFAFANIINSWSKLSGLSFGIQQKSTHLTKEDSHDWVHENDITFKVIHISHLQVFCAHAFHSLLSINSPSIHFQKSFPFIEADKWKINDSKWKRLWFFEFSFFLVVGFSILDIRLLEKTSTYR